jgi:hypothetical protein
MIKDTVYYLNFNLRITLNYMQSHEMIFWAYNGLSYKSIYSYFFKVVHGQSEKFEYERERLLGIALKIH